MSSTGAGEQSAYNVPSRPEGDVWAPEGVSVEASGSVYMVTGDSDNQTFDLGNAVIKLTPHLSFVDTSANYFAQTNWQYTNTNDLDLGNTGATLLPGNLVFTMGKYNTGYLLNASDLGGIGGQLFSAPVCGAVNAPWPYGAWGATSFANGVIYVPCGGGLDALQLHPGAHPTFTSLWNYTGLFAGPPIIAAGAVWTVRPRREAVRPRPADRLSPLQHVTGHRRTLHDPVGRRRPPLRSSERHNLRPEPVISDDHVVADGGQPEHRGPDDNGLRGCPVQLRPRPGLEGLHACHLHPGRRAIVHRPGRKLWKLRLRPLGGHEQHIGPTTDLYIEQHADHSGLRLRHGEFERHGRLGRPERRGRNRLSCRSLRLGRDHRREGYTPAAFTTTVGQTYGVRVESYGSCTFSNWSYGVTSDPRTFTAATAPASLTADYSCGRRNPPQPSTRSTRPGRRSAATTRPSTTRAERPSLRGSPPRPSPRQWDRRTAC